MTIEEVLREELQRRLGVANK